MHLTYFMRSFLYRGTFQLRKNLVQKNIMTTPRKLQEIIDDLKGNPYYDKYAERISKLQQTKPDEFKSKIEVIAKVKTAAPAAAPKERQFSQLLTPKAKLPEAFEAKEESLEKIMKIDLIKEKSAEEITEIWRQYHMEKEFLSATIPKNDFDKLVTKSKKYPIFIFPLPRSQGYEFIMCQFQRNTVHFTPLLYYQVHKENAPECLTIKHYTEFKDDKGVVLMRGEFDKNVVDAKEAQCLANLLKLYYTEDDPIKDELLEIFTKRPDEFKHQDLINQVETISL